MPSLQIPDLPADVHQALAFRAEREHHSAGPATPTVKLRRIPEPTTRERRQVVEHIRADLSEPGQTLTPAPEDVVREDQER